MNNYLIRKISGIIIIITCLIRPLSAETAISLPEAIRLAQNHSYEVKSSLADSLAAVGNYKAAKASRWPTLSLSATSYYLDETQEISIIPPTEIELGSHENYQAKFTLTLPLFVGGRISRQIDIQRELIDSKVYGMELKRIETAYLTRKAYLNVLACSAYVQSAQASVERVENILSDTKSRYNAGLADSLDILEAEIASIKAQDKLAEAKTAKNNAGVIFEQLVGISEPLDWRLSENVPQPRLQKYPRVIDDSTEIKRPELKLLESSFKISQKNVSLYKADYYPSLNGFSSYTTGKPNNNMFENEWNDQITAGLTLTWNFNLGGNTYRKVQAARQQTEIARYSKLQLQESLTYQAKIALGNLRQAYNSYLAVQKEYQNATQKFRLASTKHEAGNLALNRLIEQEDDLTSTEQLYEASKINFYIYETEYFYAIGSEQIYGGL